MGKTTSAVNIAAYLAVTETPTLLIDMDPQANATSGVGIEVGSPKQSIYDVIIGKAKLSDVIQKTDLEFLDIAPSSAQLVGAEIELVSLFSREKMLKEALEDVEGKYKYIIIDSPPSLGLLTINVLTSAHSIVIPIQCEYYALEGLSQLLNTIRLVQKHLNKELEIEGILITMYDHRPGRWLMNCRSTLVIKCTILILKEMSAWGKRPVMENRFCSTMLLPQGHRII